MGEMKIKIHMRKKELILLGFILLSMFLFIQPIRAVNGLIEVEPFIIDGNSGWENLATSQSWCSGNGTKNNPYIIEKIKIEYKTQESGHCLEIKNSELYFIIRECIFYRGFNNGLMLYNCSNGLIINNLCYNSVHNNGIELVRSENNIITNNTCFDNGDYGIYISAYGENNTVQENNIGTNVDGGIAIFMAYNNQIINNSIIGDYKDHYDKGIYTRESDNNLIDGNLIDHARTGIELEVSDFNNITNNVVHYYQNTIQEVGVDGHYCEGNIIENNTLIFDDFMPPSISIRDPQENQVFNNTPPSFNIYIVERLSTGIDSQWYTLDNGDTNHTFNLINFDTGVDSYGEYVAGDGIGVINQETWDLLENGNIMIRFYAKDNKGYIAYKELTVIKNAPESEPQSEPVPIIEYILGFTFFGIIILSGFIGRKYYKKRDTR